MTFRITYEDRKELVLIAESWNDLFRHLKGTEIKIERIDKAESEVEDGNDD